MANYDYKCEKCGNIQEESHPMGGPIEELSCTKCDCKDLEKTYESAPYSLFKGEGWCTNSDRGIDKG